MTTGRQNTRAGGTAITVKAADLVRVLNDAALFAGTDDTLPQLCSVLLEAVDGTLTATATNRYIFGHARAECTGSLPAPLVIRAVDARLITQLFRPARKSVTGPSVTITPDGPLARFAYTDSDSLGLVPELGVAVRLVDDVFPKYRDLLQKACNAERDASKAVGFNASLLSTFGRVSGARVHHLRVFLGSPGSATVVEVGDHFIGMIMPVRIDLPGKEPTAPSVPIGHTPKKPRRAKETAA